MTPDPRGDNNTTDAEIQEQIKALVSWSLAHHELVEVLDRHIAEQDRRITALEIEVERLFLYRPPGIWPMTRRAKTAHFAAQQRAALGEEPKVAGEDGRTQPTPPSTHQVGRRRVLDDLEVGE